MRGVKVVEYTQPTLFAVVTMTLADTAKKINSFTSFSDGWHYGKGVAPSASVASNAINMYKEIIQVGFSATDAFPGAEGEVMVTGYRGPYYVECVVEPNGTYNIVGENGREQIVEKSGASFSVAVETINNMARQAWNSFDLSIQNITMPDAGNLKVWPSKTQVPTTPLQFSSPLAWTALPMAGAGTSASTIVR